MWVLKLSDFLKAGFKVKVLFILVLWEFIPLKINQDLSDSHFNQSNSIVSVQEGRTSIEGRLSIGYFPDEKQLLRLCELRGGESNISELIIKVVLILTMSRNLRPTNAFQVKPPTNSILNNPSRVLTSSRTAPRPRQTQYALPNRPPLG